MEIFIPVFVALLLHSGIIRLLDEIQMYFVSKRVSEKVRNLLQERSEDEDVLDNELDNIIRLLQSKENQKKENNDPNGEWKYLD